MKKLNIVYLLILSTILTGCTTENKNSPNTPTEQIPNVSNNTSIENLVNNSSKVKIDLSLINNNIKNVPSLTMSPRIFNFEEIRSIFFSDTITSEELWENESGSAVSYVNSIGNELDIYTGYIRYATKLGSHMRSIFNPKTASISSTKSKELFDLINTVKEEELPFASQDDVIKEGVEFCKNLGITVSTNKPIVFALEYDKINQIQEQLIKENFFLKEFDEKLLDKSDSCYYIIFEVEENGISIDSSGYTSQSTGDLMNGSSIIMIISSSGIEYFEVSTIIYENKESIIENKTLVPIQTCLDKYINKYDNNILVKNVSADNIKLCYVPIPKKDSQNVIFQPAWIFYSEIDVIIDEKSGTTHTMRDVTRIDATTGKEIL